MPRGRDRQRAPKVPQELARYHDARVETIGIEHARPARPKTTIRANEAPRVRGVALRRRAVSNPLRAGSPAQVVKPGRRHRLRRGCHLRTPRSGPGATDETRRPQTGSVCGWKGAERFMPKILPVRSGQWSSPVLRDSYDVPSTNHAKRVTTDHPAREDAAPMVWQADAGSVLVIRVPPSQAMRANLAAPPGSSSTSIRSRHAAADRIRSGTCRTTFLEGG